MNEQQAQALVNALTDIAKSLKNIDQVLEKRLAQIALKKSS